MVKLHAIKIAFLALMLFDAVMSSSLLAACSKRSCWGAEDCHAAEISFRSCQNAERAARNRTRQRREEEFRKQLQPDSGNTKQPGEENEK